IRGNQFIRTAGTGPTRWIGIDSSCRDTKIYDNNYIDLVGTTPRLSDAGVNTRFDSGVQARNGTTNVVLIPAYFIFDWPQIPSGSNTATVVTVTGVTNTDHVQFQEDLNTYTNAFSLTNAVFKAFASNGTVHVLCRNHGAFTIDPGNGTNRLMIFKTLATE